MCNFIEFDPFRNSIFHLLGACLQFSTHRTQLLSVDRNQQGELVLLQIAETIPKALFYFPEILQINYVVKQIYQYYTENLG